MMSALIVVNIVGGIREILASVEPLEFVSEQSAAVQYQSSVNKPRLVLSSTKCSLQDCDERNGSKSGRNGEK